ncbi:MAG: hypothetical protein V5A28_10530 [Haloarculaceae archaeon]
MPDSISGGVIDDSEVEKLRIVHDYGPPGRSGGASETYLRTDVGDNFSVPMELGYTDGRAETNEFVVTVVDEFDNVRRYTFEVEMGDGAPPSISPEPFPDATTEGPADWALAVDRSESEERADDRETGEPQIFVSNVTVNRTQVTTRTVEVPAGGEATVEFRTPFAETGNHTVSVNGTRAGPVVVSSGGGPLSVFSVLSMLPLRLIGMGLGAFVGLAVVLTLVRFVLRRVGGGEADG